jgi:hypothetical protein
MDWLSRNVAWLSDHEAGISAVADIMVIGELCRSFRRGLSETLTR